MAGSSQLFLILDFQGLIPAQAAAVAVSEITNPRYPAFFLATDLLLLLLPTLCLPAVLFLAIGRAGLCLLWGEPGSAGLDRPLS